MAEFKIGDTVSLKSGRPADDGGRRAKWRISIHQLCLV